MIHQAKPNPQLLDEQIFSERPLRPRFLLLCRVSDAGRLRDSAAHSAAGVRKPLDQPHDRGFGGPALGRMAQHLKSLGCLSNQTVTDQGTYSRGGPSGSKTDLAHCLT